MKRTTKKTLQTLGLVSAFSMLGTSAFAGILKSPYLIYEMPNTTMTVLWQDNATETTNTLSWGTDTTYSWAASTVPEELSSTPGRGGVVNQHRYKITGLAPNTTYYYQVADTTGGVYGTGSFTTAPDESAQAIRFIAQGDSRSNPFLLNNIMKAITGFTALPGNSDYARMAIHNGDWVSSDGDIQLDHRVVRPDQDRHPQLYRQHPDRRLQGQPRQFQRLHHLLDEILPLPLYERDA